MSFTSTKKYYNTFIRTVITACCLLLFFPAVSRAATGTYGWFTPIASEIAVDTSCGSSAVVYEVALKEHDSNTDANPTQTQIRVKVINKTTKSVVDSVVGGVGDLVSPSICFDPQTNVIKVDVLTYAGASYHPFTGVATSFRVNGGSAPINDLLGHRVRGYVHLSPTSTPVPDVEHVAPNNGALLPGDPTSFIVQTHNISSVFGATKVKKTKLYLRGVSGPALGYKDHYTYNTNGTGIFALTNKFPSLSSGQYKWYFHQTLNGEAHMTAGGKNIEFKRIPKSAISSPRSFTVDNVLPVVGDIKFTDRVVTATYEEVTVKLQSAQDIISGIASTTILIRDSSGAQVASQQFIYTPPVTSVLHPQITNVQLFAGETYHVLAIVEDAAGNIRMRSTTRTVALGPTVTLLGVNPSDVTMTATTTGEVVAEGGAPVTNRGVCISKTNINPVLSDTDSACLGSGTGLGVFDVVFSSLTPGRYYARAYATNSEATSYSDRIAFMVGSSSYPYLLSPLTWSCDANRKMQVTAHFFIPGNPYASTLQYKKNTSSIWHGVYGYIWGGGDFTRVISNLAYNTTYEVRLRTILSFVAPGVVYTPLGSITTGECAATPPILGTVSWEDGALLATGERTGKITGNIISDGGDPITERGVCWGTTSAQSMYTDSQSHCAVSAGTSTGFFHEWVAVPEGTLIYYRAYAKNSVGLSETTAKSTVAGATNPVLSSPHYTIVDPAIPKVEFRAIINDDGGAPVTRGRTYWCVGGGCIPTNMHEVGLSPTLHTGSTYGDVRTVDTGTIRYKVCVENLSGKKGCSSVGEFEIEAFTGTSDVGGSSGDILTPQ